MTLAVLETLRADPRVAWVEDVLRFGDTDLNGHINNATFAVLCESGRVDFFHTRLIRHTGRYFVLAHLTIDFKAELFYPGSVRTATWLTRVGRTSLGLSQALFSGEGHLAATAAAVCVGMEAASRRPIPFSDDVRAGAEAILRNTA